MKFVALYIIFEIANTKDLFCQLSACDDDFGYNHYTISFFSTFTSLEFFLLNGNVHVHQENVFEEEIMNKDIKCNICFSFFTFYYTKHGTFCFTDLSQTPNMCKFIFVV